jgi:hypothetical protein
VIVGAFACSAMLVSSTVGKQTRVDIHFESALGDAAAEHVGQSRAMSAGFLAAPGMGGGEFDRETQSPMVWLNLHKSASGPASSDQSFGAYAGGATAGRRRAPVVSWTVVLFGGQCHFLLPMLSCTCACANAPCTPAVCLRALARRQACSDVRLRVLVCLRACALAWPFNQAAPVLRDSIRHFELSSCFQSSLRRFFVRQVRCVCRHLAARSTRSPVFSRTHRFSCRSRAKMCRRRAPSCGGWARNRLPSLRSWAALWTRKSIMPSRRASETSVSHAPRNLRR